MIVLDSSALIDYLLATPEKGTWVREQILRAGWRIHAPHCIDVEVTGVLRREVLRGSLGDAQGSALVDALRDARVRRHSHLPFLRRIWQLRASVTAADAAFVALAESLGVALVTTDASLSRAPGIHCDVVTP